MLADKRLFIQIRDEGSIMLVSVRGISGALQVLADFVLDSDAFQILTNFLIEKSKFAEKIVKKMEVEPGDIQDVFDKAKKIRNLILTKKGIILIYEKGIFKKTLKLLLFPFRYAKSVKEKSVLGSTWISLEYSIPINKKNQFCFKQRIMSLKKENREKLMKALREIIGKA